ncbi:MAG TPA: DUF1553 domain-containing protein [Planctomicrobium sp.]|nr:DUF1553 domain-containing protein [Planctomicrobium sp.]
MTDYCLRTVLIVSLAACVLTAGRTLAQEPDAEGLRFFEQKIRPVLVEHCYECHSAESRTLQGQLRVDLKSALLTGGDSGPSLIPGNPDESLLLSTLRYNGDSYDMPPKGKLPDSVIADFEKWIRMGAPDPREGDAPPVARNGIDIAAGKQFWSLRPPQSSAVPTVKDEEWPQRKMDHFILSALEEANLKPSPSADRQDLLRRVYFDLVGLSPSFEETEQFKQDASPDAYEKLIERLLASPHYGERWGRHWLDVVRYAEDNVNMGPHNGPYKNAYRYRDWVIQAINADLRYDDFIRYQLAADLLPQASLEDLAALGMIGLSPQYHKELLLAQSALESVHADEWEDRVDLVSRGLMGLTAACARCHDHKYDPITTKDYYALAGVFASVRQTTRPLLPENEVTQSQPARDTVQRLQDEIKTLNDEIKKLKKAEPASETEKKARDEKLTSLTEQIAEKKKESDQIKASTPNFVLPMVDAVTEEQVRFEKATATTQKFAFYPNSPRDLPVMIRGNVTSPGEIVPRRFLEVLSDGEPEPFRQGSGRLELAEAIVSPDNPLTARVFVNRVWQRYFGEGLVDTPSNFGATGSAPSHPELLDDLAVRFMQNGWSLKWLHREILLSATYQQTSRVSSTLAEEQDPGNRLLWRFNRRRLDAETFHDALLEAGGNLDLKMGGPSADIDQPSFHRRAVYAGISRDAPSQFLQVNDFPDPTIHAEQRSLTTTPLQQLFVLNSPFVRNQAILLSDRVPQGDLAERIRKVHQLVLARDPTSKEVAIGIQFLQSLEEEPSPNDAAVPMFTGERMKATVPQLGDVYSVEIWFRNIVPYRERPVTGYLFSRGNDRSPQADGDHLGIGGISNPQMTGRLLFYNGNRLRDTLYGKTILSPDQWHQVTLVRQGKRIDVYLNGRTEPEISGVVSPGYDPDGTEMFLGGRNDQFANFRGQMGGVSLYNRALTSEEITKHFQAGMSGKVKPDHEAVTQSALSSAPFSYWPLFKRSLIGPQAKDLTPRQNHGIYEGSASNASAAMTPWRLYCHAILCSNELLYID